MTNSSQLVERAAHGSQKHEGHLNRQFQGKESILSSQISLYVQETKPKIPDGGWGWWVVFAAFMLNVISEGVTLSFGFLYIEFLEEFGASASATSWIGSLFMAIPLLAGPLASALVDKYGCKSMTVLGGVTCMIGFILSAFANSIGVMLFTFGIIGGLSRSLTYVTAVVAIAFWFEKKRTVALGLQGSGAGFGTVIFPPISTFLLSEYGWRGTLLVLAGFFANMCVCGMLMRDPEWIIEEEKREKELKNARNRPKAASKKNTAELNTNLKALLNNGEEIQALLNSQPSEVQNNDETKERYASMVNLPTFLKHNEKVPIEVLKQLRENEQLYNYILQHNPNLLTCNSTPENGLYTFDQKTSRANHLKENEMPVFPKIAEEDEAEETEASDNKPLASEASGTENKAQSKNYSHSYLKSIRFRRNSVGCRGAMLNIHKIDARASSCPNVYRVSTLDEDKDEKWYDEVLEILKNLANFSLFLELHFLMQSLSTIILFTWFIVPYFYLAEHMISIGFTEQQASFVISVIGFTNTIGMVFLGLVGDRLNVAKTYSVCLILCGLSVLSMMYFTTNYILLVINSGLFGLFFASCFSLSPALLSTLVPLDGFTMAYGLGLLCEGIGNLIGPPLAGYLFDVTQSWDQSFYQAGIWIIISGLFVGVIAFTKNRRIIGSTPLMNDRKPETRATV